MEWRHKVIYAGQEHIKTSLQLISRCIALIIAGS
jgi:hypothetical protein